jgi:hypothetical protein
MTLTVLPILSLFEPTLIGGEHMSSKTVVKGNTDDYLSVEKKIFRLYERIGLFKGLIGQNRRWLHTLNEELLGLDRRLHTLSGRLIGMRPK